MNETIEAILGQLDSAHKRAQDAFCRKDATSYMAIFTADLSYQQSDGKVIGRQQLARDVTAQLSMLHSAESFFVREGLQISGGEATEQLRQVAEVTTKHFKIVYRTWKLDRKGRYVWTRTRQGWKIRQVHVLQEHVTPGSLKLSPPYV